MMGDEDPERLTLIPVVQILVSQKQAQCGE